MNDSEKTTPVAGEQSATEASAQQVTPRIYVASLADYNAGRLHGRWIEAHQSAEAIHAEIAAMLASSREPIAEDWAIHDYENFESARLREFEAIETVAALAKGIVEHGPIFGELFNRCDGIDETADYIENHYLGAYRTYAEYVEELVEDCYGDVLKQLPEFLRYRIDYQGVAHDFECSGDNLLIECDGMVHVFGCP